MTVVALSGWRKSGKDTVANYLVKDFGFKRLAFADKLKDMVSQLYSIPREYCDKSGYKEASLFPVVSTDAFTDVITNLLEGEFAKRDGKPYWNPRALCILEGSIKRAVDPDYWVKEVLYTIKHNPKNNYVISDVRYKSEITALKEVLSTNLITARINRYTNINSTDASERDLDDYKFDCYINNTSTFEDLHKEVFKTLINR